MSSSFSASNVSQQTGQSEDSSGRLKKIKIKDKSISISFSFSYLLYHSYLCVLISGCSGSRDFCSIRAFRSSGIKAEGSTVLEKISCKTYINKNKRLSIPSCGAAFFIITYATSRSQCLEYG
jgi:hypothetical protein